MSAEETRRIIRGIRKRFRSEPQEESANKRIKDLFDGNLEDFITFLESLEDEPTGSADVTMDTMTTATGSKHVNKPDISPTDGNNAQLIQQLIPYFDNLKTSLSTEIKELHKELDSKNTKIEQLESRIEDLERSQRKNNLRVHGINYTDGESPKRAVIDTVDKYLNIKLNNTDIDDCFRLNRKGEKATDSTPILVKFAKLDVKKKVYLAKKQLKDSGTRIYFNEDLTKTLADLHKKVRELQKDGYIWKTFTNNFNIYYTVSKDDETPKLITCENDIKEIREKLPQRAAPAK